jgi:hypothetical protein
VISVAAAIDYDAEDDENLRSQPRDLKMKRGKKAHSDSDDFQETQPIFKL